MSELPPELALLRDFYLKALAPPAGAVMAHSPGLIPRPTFFTLTRLQEHLNNPLLTPDWFSLIWQGKSVDCSAAMARKAIRGQEVGFLNKAIVEQGLAQGAALVLEGIEFLEPDINALCTAIDAPHERVLSNAVVFFSQRGMEAYRGHFDAQDTLVIQLAGQKQWRIHERIPPRRVNRGELSAGQMGKLHAEITMNPGDALFLKSNAPHIVRTTGACSLHMSFDICDHNIGAPVALEALLKESQAEPMLPYAALTQFAEQIKRHARSPAFRQHLASTQAATDRSNRNLRSMAGVHRVTCLDQLASALAAREGEIT